jgi:hypothetical protein
MAWQALAVVQYRHKQKILKRSEEEEEDGDMYLLDQMRPCRIW